jgi:hypothetical protein
LLLCAGTCLPLCHASLRSPNLKARLASAREEFRAVWCAHVLQYACSELPEQDDTARLHDLLSIAP